MQALREPEHNAGRSEMIPAAFEYYRPKDMSGVIALLEEHGDDARVMAGGHSLIPMMKLRMADIPHLIDLQDVSGLGGIEVSGDTVRIGAMATQAEISADIMASKVGQQIIEGQCSFSAFVCGIYFGFA